MHSCDGLWICAVFAVCTWRSARHYWQQGTLTRVCQSSNDRADCKHRGCHTENVSIFWPPCGFWSSEQVQIVYLWGFVACIFSSSSQFLYYLCSWLFEGGKTCCQNHLSVEWGVPVLVGAKLSFVQPGHRCAYSPSPSKAPVLYYENLREDVKNLRRSLTVIWCFFVSSGASVGRLRVSSFFEPWLVRLSAAKSWVFAKGFPREAPLPNVPSLTPVHHQ